MYEASVYEFQSSGTLRLVDNYTSGDSPEYVVGQVWKGSKCPSREHCPPNVICEFGNKWQKIVFQVISIRGNCSDSVQRNIVLWVLPRLYDNYAVVLLVGGTVGWHHGPFYWHWTKCIDLDDCMPWD